MTYNHHVHSITSNSATAESDSWESSSVTNTYSDSYKASSSGGCFTTAHYAYTYKKCGSTSWTYLYDTGDSAADGAPGKMFRCNSCGSTTHAQTWTTPGKCDKKIVSGSYIDGYTKSCGFTAGQVVGININFN